jgi:hypothetical protein
VSGRVHDRPEEKDMNEHVWRQVAHALRQWRRREHDRRCAAHREQVLMVEQVRLQLR